MQKHITMLLWVYIEAWALEYSFIAVKYKTYMAILFFAYMEAWACELEYCFLAS